MKVALVHDWLTGMRGGERCLEALCEIFPEAKIFTLVHIPGSVSSTIERHHIIPSFLNSLPFVKRHYRYYLPLFPLAIQSFDFQEFDLIVSSSHCVAKGISVPKGTCHISYIHTPMRYIWDAHDQYFGEKACCSLEKLAMAVFRKRLQKWDVKSNTHVHAFVANSQNVAERIKHYYGREAIVVYPPVDWQELSTSECDEGFYLMVTAFVPYKRVDIAINIATRLKISLKIIGKGPEEKQLQKLAGPTVEFLGWKTDEDVREFYRKCTALLFPGEEDFGIVPLEAMASGKPVIAYGKGGVLETVIPINPKIQTEQPFSPTGVFFYEQTENALSEAITLFESKRSMFRHQAIRTHVQCFDKQYFQEQIHQVIMTTYQQFRQSLLC